MQTTKYTQQIIFLILLLTISNSYSKECAYDIEEIAEDGSDSWVRKSLATPHGNKDKEIIKLAKKSCSSSITNCQNEIDLIKKQGYSSFLTDDASLLFCGRPLLEISPNGIASCSVTLWTKLYDPDGDPEADYSADVPNLKITELPACEISKKKCEQELKNGKYVEWAECIPSWNNETVFLD